MAKVKKEIAFTGRFLSRELQAIFDENKDLIGSYRKRAIAANNDIEQLEAFLKTKKLGFHESIMYCCRTDVGYFSEGHFYIYYNPEKKHIYVAKVTNEEEEQFTLFQRPEEISLKLRLRDIEDSWKLKMCCYLPNWIKLLSGQELLRSRNK